MGSKKHKKESKKKKHKSRSRSPIDGVVEKERKRHKKHKKRSRSSDVEEVPVDSHLLPQNGDSVREEHERDRRIRKEHREKSERDRHRDDGVIEIKDYTEKDSSSRDVEREVSHKHHREKERDNSNHDRHERDRHKEASVSEKEDVQPTTSNAESLSIEETNKLRIKLGLKPLQVEDKIEDDGKIKDDLGEFYHKPAANISEQKKSDKIKQRLEERREKRKLEQNLKTTLLAEGSDDEDASAWVLKSRDIEKQKKIAARRAAMLDEMDQVFGVGALVAEDAREQRDASYTARQLTGLRVAHDINNISEDRELVLTLADKNVLDEDVEDVLVNVNIIDNEKYRKNIEDRKKAKTGYQAYDDEEDMEAAALGCSKPVLAKYDDEINKGQSEKEKGFVIGDDKGIKARMAMIRERMAVGVEKRLETLLLPERQIASDYLSEQEVNAKFKKTKKKGKIRKKPKIEPIDVDTYDPNAVPLETDDTDVKPEEFKMETMDEDEVEPDSELQVALERARRLRQTQMIHRTVPKVEDILERVKEEPTVADSSGCMVLDATAEFARALGDMPTYGQAGNRDSNVEIMDFEDDVASENEMERTSAWSRVDVKADKPADITATTSAVLDVEPSLGTGVGGALQLALSKGYLEKQGGVNNNTKNSAAHLLAARHYSIEDKSSYTEDDKHSRRERTGYTGPLQDFREKHIKPNIKLEYVDDDGRPLCPKEAFRYLSHKFHGKGPGKNKQEKRIKKAVQEGLMKKMSSTDTPLNTLQMLQDKQKETHSPYVVLSGAKKEQN